MDDAGMGGAALGDEERPEVALAGLPASLIVTGLADQLSRASTGYSESDFLAPILSAAALLRGRYAGDAGTIAEVRRSVSAILDSVVGAVSADWGAELDQLGLDPELGDYEPDVLELYRFFVSERMRNARELLYRLVSQDRRRIADRYRKSVEKRNQTTAEARRIFANFDDVVVWASMPAVVEEMRNQPSWSVPLADVLAALGAQEAGDQGAGFLAAASQLWGQTDFAARYSAPALRLGEASTTTVLRMRDRWLADCPKKTGDSN